MTIETIEKDRDADHKAILVACENLAQFGYRVKGITCADGELAIRCYCPRVSEGSISHSKDGVSNAFKD